ACRRLVAKILDSHHSAQVARVAFLCGRPQSFDLCVDPPLNRHTTFGHASEVVIFRHCTRHLVAPKPLLGRFPVHSLPPMLFDNSPSRSGGRGCTDALVSLQQDSGACRHSRRCFSASTLVVPISRPDENRG